MTEQHKIIDHQDPLRKEQRQEALVYKGERVDDLERSGLRIIQNPDRFCFGMDAVLLSGFACCPANGRICDLGTGTGIIPILMSAKTKASLLAGVEIQQEMADMARRSVRLNHLEDRIHIITGDIRRADEFFAPASFDAVTCNPPYMIAGHGLINADDSRTAARHEIFGTFSDIAKAAAGLLGTGRHFYLVHRPFRLVELFDTLTRYRLEPKRMRLVYPYADKEPNMVLLDCVKDGNRRLQVEKPLIVYQSQGRYTDEIMDIYGY